MEKHYFVPVVNRVYTNRNDKQYRCTGFVEGSCPWETVAYFTRLSDGWSLAAHGPKSMKTGRLNGTILPAGIGRSKKEGNVVNQEIIPAYSAYQKVIDLTLYHAFAELIVQMAQDDEVRILYRQQEVRQIWQRDQNVSGYFETYSLRYPGEVLERFEEKLGTDMRILRALALALGYTRQCQADTMFVGNQRNDFIQKLRRTAGTDVYLQGALYLLETDAPQRRARLDALAAREYARTEEALFVLSLFDDPEAGYQAMRPQLTRLFGPDRTLSLEWDFGVLEWFIRFYAEEAKRYRGKTDLVVRTLLKLPYMNMKPDSREFSILLTAGYSMEEITLANSLAVWADRIPGRLLSKGITAEKIAAACVRMLLNCPDGQPEEIYAYIGWLFLVYQKFEVKYEGYQDLWAAIQMGLAPTAPRTILWMNKTVKRQFSYRFDVFNPRYDILASGLSKGEYAELFTEQMLRSRAAIPLRRWLTRYQALTGVEYIEYFNKRHWLTLRSFVLLVERKEINLWQFFEQHKGDGARAHPLELLEEYALKISSWRCFRFAQKLFSQYTFSQLQEIFGDNFYFHQKFVKKESYYNKKVQSFSMVRPFLTAEQHRQLYDWIDASLFQTEPEYYDSFVLCALKAPVIQRIYDKPLLASVLRQLLTHDACGGYEVNQLKERFYSKEEMEADRKATAEQEEQEKERQWQQQVMKCQEKLASCYNGSAESLIQFMHGYHFGEIRKAALGMVYEKLLEWPAGCAQTLEAAEMWKFFELCGSLVMYEPRPRGEILTMVQTIVGGESA